MKFISVTLSLIILSFTLSSSLANSKDIPDNSKYDKSIIICTIFKVHNNHYACKSGAQVKNINDFKQCILISKDVYKLINSSTRLEDYLNASGLSGPPTPGE